MDYDFIDQKLKEMNMSRRQLAIECGIPTGTMSNWFARKTKKVPIDPVMKMAAILNSSWKEILGVDEIDPGVYAQLPTIHEIENSESVEIPYRDEYGNIIQVQTVERVSVPDESSAAIMVHFMALNERGREKAIEAVRILTKVPEYRKK